MIEKSSFFNKKGGKNMITASMVKELLYYGKEW